MRGLTCRSARTAHPRFHVLFLRSCSFSHEEAPLRSLLLHADGLGAVSCRITGMPISLSSALSAQSLHPANPGVLLQSVASFLGIIDAIKGTIDHFVPGVNVIF